MVVVGDLKPGVLVEPKPVEPMPKTGALVAGVLPKTEAVVAGGVFPKPGGFVTWELPKAGANVGADVVGAFPKVRFVDVVPKLGLATLVAPNAGVLDGALFAPNIGVGLVPNAEELVTGVLPPNVKADDGLCCPSPKAEVVVVVIAPNAGMPVPKPLDDVVIEKGEALAILVTLVVVVVAPNVGIIEVWLLDSFPNLGLFAADPKLNSILGLGICDLDSAVVVTAAPKLKDGDLDNPPKPKRDSNAEKLLSFLLSDGLLNVKEGELFVVSAVLNVLVVKAGLEILNVGAVDLVTGEPRTELVGIFKSNLNPPIF